MAASKSGIEWTESTWNPVTGCSKVSPGCKRCYAEAITDRFQDRPGWHPFTEVRLRTERLVQPYSWRKPRMVFVNSMSDLFHEAVPDAYIERVCGVMAQAAKHTYQVLTKRHERMRRMLNGALLEYAGLSNIWWGVSAEDVPFGQPRINALLDTPALVKWASVEPLIGEPSALRVAGLDWVVVGGESGPGARPMEAAWARSVRDECGRRRIPFFFKQWGGPRAGGAALLDGREHRAYPEGAARAKAAGAARYAITLERARAKHGPTRELLDVANGARARAGKPPMKWKTMEAWRRRAGDAEVKRRLFRMIAEQVKQGAKR